MNADLKMLSLAMITLATAAQCCWGQLALPMINELPRLSVALPTIKAVQQTNGYVIVPDDVVWMKVYQEDDLETRAKVTKEGLVTIPLLGPVSIAGKTVDDASAWITKLLDQRFIVNPQVTLSVVEYSKRRFTILGQVGRAGIYEYPGDEQMTVLEAIALAGGFGRLAAKSKVKVQRLEDGAYKTYNVDPEAMQNRRDGKLFYVQPGDTITVGARIF